MPTRENFKQLSRVRLQEARLLFNNGFYDGAYYLSGYVLECALKARICKILEGDYPEGRDKFNSFLTHKFDVLVKLGGLEKKLALKLRNTTFKTNWSLLTDPKLGWKETFRYDMGIKTRREMEDIFAALTNRRTGVLTWLRGIW